MSRYIAAALACAACLLPLWLVQPAAAQGALDELRGSVRQPQEKKKKRRKSCGHPYRCDCNNDNFFGALLSEILSNALTGMVNQDNGGGGSARQRRVRQQGYFPSYPYQGELEGYMMIEPWVPAEPWLWALRTRVEYADDFDDLSRIGGHLLYETTSRFGVDAELNYRRETLSSGLGDSLWTGDTNLLYRFWQTTQMQQRIGLGVNWLSDDMGREYGPQLTYSGDWYPRRPWVISSELDYGQLGSATLFHGRLPTGLQWDRVEFFVGYNYYDVGSAQIDGLVSGLRLSF